MVQLLEPLHPCWEYGGSSWLLMEEPSPCLCSLSLTLPFKTSARPYPSTLGSLFLLELCEGLGASTLRGCLAQSQDSFLLESDVSSLSPGALSKHHLPVFLVLSDLTHPLKLSINPSFHSKSSWVCLLPLPPACQADPCSGIAPGNGNQHPTAFLEQVMQPRIIKGRDYKEGWVAA